MAGKTERRAYSHIMKYTGLFGGVQFLAISIALVRNKIVAMLLGPGGIGLMSLLNSYSKMVSDSTMLGLPMSAVRGISEAYGCGDRERAAAAVSAIRSWSLVTAALGAAVCLLAGPLLNTASFSWGDHTLHFMLLAPAVAFTALTGGELAILKGTRRLRDIAVQSVAGTMGVLVATTPLFYIWGEAAIVPSIVIAAAVAFAAVGVFSYKLYPLRGTVGAAGLAGGKPMVKLGLSFLGAGVLGSGADLFLRSYLNNAHSLDTVGLFNAGYVICTTFGGLVFSALETDFFPRLSAAGGTVDELNSVVNRQVEVSLLLAAPFTAALVLSLPILVPLMYTADFSPAEGMVACAALSIFLKSIALPVAYIPLAKGHSRVYLAMEAASDAAMVAMGVAGFRLGGIAGLGAGLSAAVAADLALYCAYFRVRYGFRLSGSVVKYAALHAPVLVGMAALGLFADGWAYWAAGAALLAAGAAISVHILRGKTRLWQALMKRFRR